MLLVCIQHYWLSLLDQVKLKRRSGEEQVDFLPAQHHWRSRRLPYAQTGYKFQWPHCVGLARMGLSKSHATVQCSLCSCLDLRESQQLADEEAYRNRPQSTSKFPTQWQIPGFLLDYYSFLFQLSEKRPSDALLPRWRQW